MCYTWRVWRLRWLRLSQQASQSGLYIIAMWHCVCVCGWDRPVWAVQPMTCVSSTPNCELAPSALSRDRCSSAADKLVTNSSTCRTVRTSCRSPSTPHRQPLNPSTSCSSSKVCLLPRAGSAVVRIDALRFLAGCRTRRLNQDLSILSLSLDFFECVCCAVNKN